MAIKIKSVYLAAGFCLWLLLPVMAPPLSGKGKQAFKDQFLSLINSKRARGCKCGATYMPPVKPLSWNDALASAALEHATDMYKNNYFDHNSINGRTLQYRLLKVGYGYKGFKFYTIGENIAQGQQTIDEVITDWFKSVGHCKNLMNPGFKEIGVAEYHYYWVQDFGGRVPFSSFAKKGIN